jgi:hypothetical protein
MIDLPNTKYLSEAPHKIERDVLNSLDGVYRIAAERLIESGAWVISDA